MKLYCKNNCRWQDLFGVSNQQPTFISSTFPLLQEAVKRVHVSDPAAILCNYCFAWMLAGVWWDHSGCVHGQGLPCGMLSLRGRSAAFSGSEHLIVITTFIFKKEIDLLPSNGHRWAIQTLHYVSFVSVAEKCLLEYRSFCNFICYP